MQGGNEGTDVFGLGFLVFGLTKFLFVKDMSGGRIPHFELN